MSVFARLTEHAACCHVRPHCAHAPSCLVIVAHLPLVLDSLVLSQIPHLRSKHLSPHNPLTQPPS